jgi:hypothetical protein
MNTTLLILVAIAVTAWFGLKILERLPKQNNSSAFTYEGADFVVGFKVDALTETDFDISFVDGWGTGRQFMLYGPPASDSERHGGLNFGTRTGVHIHPTADWFKSTRIGWIREFDSGGCESHVYLPYQIARHVLEDVRCKPQYVRILFARKTDKDGKSTYPIYGFELSDPLD